MVAMESTDDTSANLAESGEASLTEHAEPVGRPKRTKWRDLPRSRKASAVILSAAVSLGVALILAGVSGSATGKSQSNLPDEIEQIQPALGDKVLNQANLVVDLIPGYTGRLIVDELALQTVSTAESEPTGGTGGGVVTPTTVVLDPDAVRFDAGNNTLTYQPRPGGTIERFPVGRHIAKVIYWKLTESEASSYSYTWYFDVTA